MPLIPLPFLVAVLLLVLLAAVLRGADATPVNRAFLALIAACAVQSVLLGLRWGYGVEAIRFVLPVMAAVVPPLVYASFGGLAQTGSDRRRPRELLHALPAVLIAGLVVAWPAAIDLAIVLIYLGYALATLRLAPRGPDALGQARLEGAAPAYRALQAAAAALIGSAAVDVIVLLDFEWTRGEHAAAVVGISNVLSLFVLGFAAMVAGRSEPPAESEEKAPAAASAAPVEDADDPDAEAVVAVVEALMRTKALFRDADLNLNRLARRAGLPARRISLAINRLRGNNVSQYINGFRIAEACRLLVETDAPVTRIMFDAGFQTKSNFNREFRRVTGMNPVAWREKGRAEGREKGRAALIDPAARPL